MRGKDFKKFLNLKLIDIADGIFGESISFIFENEKKELIGFKIVPHDIKHCEICKFKIVNDK